MRYVLCVLLAFAAAKAFAALDLTYNNTDFNQPAWSDTLTLTNNSDAPVVMTALQFDTNDNTLQTGGLYGSIFHSATSVNPNKISDFDYRYTLVTESPYSAGTFTTIPAHGSVNLTGIPLAHEQTSVNGIPVYHRLPFHVQVTLQDGSIVTPHLLGACEGVACQDPLPQKLLGAYYTDWANYAVRDKNNILMPNQIPVADMNTIYYAIGKIDPQTASVGFLDINTDQYYFPAFDTLRSQFPYLNLIYSFGGWGDAGVNSYPSYVLATIFDQKNPSLIQTLADNMVHTMLELGFNGIDIDYEWNAIQPNSPDLMQLTPARALGYQTLMQDIRQDLNTLQGHYLLTTAVFAGPDKVNDFVANGGDWKVLAAAADTLGVMTYDLHGQFDAGQISPDNVSDFLSMMQTEHHYTAEMLNHYNVVDGINAYLQQGVSPNKLVLGVPAYTRMEQTALPIDDTNKGLYLTLSTSQPLGEENNGGMTNYKCIVNNDYCLDKNAFSFDRTHFIYVPTVLSSQGLGSLAKTPWAYDKTRNWVLTFDDDASIAYKANWVKQQGLAGIMIWELDGDLAKTSPEYQAHSLIYNAWLELK